MRLINIKGDGAVPYTAKVTDAMTGEDLTPDLRSMTITVEPNNVIIAELVFMRRDKKGWPKIKRFGRPEARLSVRKENAQVLGLDLTAYGR